MADRQRLQSLSEDFQKVQTELQSIIDARQKLESQQQENKTVQDELSRISDDSDVFKLVGPVLLKQDKSEALMTVNQRLDFIENEIKRIEKQITEASEKAEKMKIETMQIQSQMQQAASAGGS